MLAAPPSSVEHPPHRRDELSPEPPPPAKRRVTSRQFLADLARLGGMQFLLAVAGLLRYKVLALRLGSSGLGEFQQLVTAAGTATVVVSFGLAFALNRNIATARDTEHRQRLLATSNAIVWALTGVVYLSCFAALAFDPELVDRIGVKATPSVIATLAILLIGIPFEALKSNLVTFLMASLDVRGVTSRRSIAVLAATIVSIPMVWVFGAVGASIQSVLINLVLVAALGYRCIQLGFAPFRLRLDRESAGVLAAFGLAQLCAGFVQQFLDLVVRTNLITQYNASQNGFYQSALLLAGQVQTVVLSGVASYALASLGNERDRAHATASSNLLLRTVLPVGALAFAAIGILAKPLLVVLYSASFAGAVAFIPFVLATMFLEAVLWVIDAPLLAHRGVRIWLLLNVTYYSLRAVAAIALLPIIGPKGVAVGYFAAMCLHVSMHLFVFTRVLGLTIDRSHFRQLVLGLALILGTAWPASGTSAVLFRYLVAASVYLAYFGYVVHRTIGISGARSLVRRLRPESVS
jgi:O-antigen/teichoic acid export membrane protein